MVRTMSAVPNPCESKPAQGSEDGASFSQELVSITKAQHIELVSQAKRFQSLHARAVRREQWRHERFGRIVRRLKEQAGRREAELLAELALTQAKIRDLRQRVFGRKSEQSKGASEQRRCQSAARAPRGQRHGTRGHGRSMQSHLPERGESVRLDSPQCPKCGLALEEFPGTQDSEVLEIEVKAYRRAIRRQRYKPACACGCLPGIVTAPAPANLMARGKFGVSVWSTVLLDKFLYGRPSARLLRDLSDHGLNMSPGTLAGGLQALAPLFEPLEQALVAKLRSEAHWHADETRWAVFVEIEGKVGHRWYMWVFHSPSVVHYVLDQSRATQVVQDELAGVHRGIISCDRYAAYKRFSRLNPGVVLAFCWAHVRRDYLETANAWPDLSKWAMGWVDAIGGLYHLNALRLGAAQGSTERAGRDDELQRAVQAMATRMNTEMAEMAEMGQIGLSEPALKVLTSMKNHWDGLTVFVHHPWVPMDNNAAERVIRTPVIGRKNFYGSSSLWSGQLAATMYSLLMTAKLWSLNPRTWLTAYLQACAEHGSQAPSDASAFLPWAMDARQLAAMRACPAGAAQYTVGQHGLESFDTS